MYYSRNETYAMDWSLDDIDLNDVLVSVGTFGGPLGRYYLVCCCCLCVVEKLLFAYCMFFLMLFLLF